MSYFYGQPLQHPNTPLNYQPQTSQISPHLQSISSNPSISNPNFAYNPYPNHGVYPINHGSEVYPPNYSGFIAQPINQLENGGVSTNWVVKQAAPINYSHAIQPVSTEYVATTSYESPVNYNLVGPNLVARVPEEKIMPLNVIQKEPSVSHSVRCELCNIDCDTVEVYEKHLKGKKHNKVLLKTYGPTTQSAPLQASQPSNMSCSAGQVVTPGGQSVPGVAKKPSTLEAKKKTLLDGGYTSIKVCTICDVLCNGEIAFADHLAGKKHFSQERAHATVLNSNPAEINAQHIISKKRKIEDPASMWCDVCKISCTSSDLLNMHFVGKKHQKNLLRLQNSNYKTNALGSTPASLPSTNSSTEINTASFNSPCPQPIQAKKEQKNVEMKKRIILENGASVNAVKSCTICDVVCNSDIVFYSHLTGKHHASMLKQSQAASASNGLQAVYPAE